MPAKRRATVREEVVFNGMTFYRYPEAKAASSRSYYYSPPVPLHRAVWEFHNGPVPDGHHIHHIDGDSGNNDPSNLECLSVAVHLTRHAPGVGATKEHMDKIRDDAIAAKRSERGRSNHAEGARKMWAKRTTHLRICEDCGEDFESYSPTARHCSAICRQRARLGSGVDRVERVCTICSTRFLCNKYGTQKTCSLDCGAESRKRAMKAQVERWAAARPSDPEAKSQSDD